MPKKHSIKNLVSRAASDPWNVVTGRRPGSYQIPEVGRKLMDIIDFAVFERKIEKAIATGIIFEKWAERDIHFACKAAAVMSTVYCVVDMKTIAEEKLVQAKGRIRDCKDCKAHCLKRSGIFLVYNDRARESLQVYSEAITLFGELGDHLEEAKCLINRGVVKSIMEDFESGLADQKAAMNILESNPRSGHYITIGAINRAGILTKMGNLEAARDGVEEAQRLLAGVKDVERPKLVLRWIKALLLEATGDKKNRKLAGQLLDRVECRMRSLGMHRELRVLLADRARIARAPHTIKQIARKAFAMEKSGHVQRLIQATVEDATQKNIMEWRNALDSYVPPLSETA